MSRSGSLLELRLGHSVLTAVPAVHFRLAFAREVNRICCDTRRRPDAIAVELGPISAAAARDWLAELGVGPERRKRLPVMLGLVKPNRCFRPSGQERTLAFQRELGVSPYTTLMLSPTDSIIEAIRCACELGVPVYGVDLEDIADPQVEPAQIQDPSSALDRVEDYVQQHAPLALPYDEEIDPRREVAMAARLKTLSRRHKRLLFTCGMAHWQRLRAHLLDGSLGPAPVDPIPADEPALAQFERIAVDPRIAAHYLDLVPALGRAYEQARLHPLLGGGVAPAKPLVPASLLGGLLRRVYRRYFRGSDQVAWGPALRRDWSAAPAFEQLLGAQASLSLRALPTLRDIYGCASPTMSREFCRVLGETLMDIPWAEPRRYGTQARLELAGGQGNADAAVIRRDSQNDSEPFALKLAPGQSIADWPAPPEVLAPPAAWNKALATPWDSAYSFSHYSWQPWDNLATGLCWRAIRSVRRRERLPVSEEFAGQLLDGIDVKATLRAQARGEQRLFVRGSRTVSVTAASDIADGFPVIWLFDTDPADLGCQYECYCAPMSQILLHGRDPGHFRRVASERGDLATAVVAFGELKEDSGLEYDTDVDVRRVDLRGIVFYGPLFCGYRQFARWFERTNFTRNPFIGFSLCMGLPEKAHADLVRRVGTPSRLRWQDVLVCSALPYGSGSVTLVAPPGFTLAPAVRRLAACYGRTVRVTSLKRFPDAYIKRLKLNAMVSGIFDSKADTTVYDTDAERVLGEPLDLYMDLVPKEWRRFGSDD